MNNPSNISANEGVGLYVHVPFCARPCEFCAFYQEKPDKNGIEDYLNTIEQELKKYPPVGNVQTVFMGGGTPSLLATSDLERLCCAIKKAAPNAIEWTIEMAPQTVKADKLSMLKRMGVNRFSMGIQSFDPHTLDAIGRPHTAAQVSHAIALIKEAQIENWNLDLIFAASEETLESWLEDLRLAVELGPKHISTYCLTFESDTKLFLKMLAGKKTKPTPQQEALFYRATWDFLAKAGYQQYEVSNFAQPGYACAHNRATWNMGQWFGYGPAAASQLRQGDGYLRYTNVSDLGSWGQGVKTNKRAWVDIEELSKTDVALDALLFGVRMPEGVSLGDVQDRFGKMDSALLTQLNQLKQNLQDEGLLGDMPGDTWKLTQEGLLVADAVAESILSLS